MKRLPIDIIMRLNTGFLGALLDKTIRVNKDLKVCVISLDVFQPNDG